MNDPVVEEIRKYREQYAARFGYDLTAICRDLRERQGACGRQVVSRPPKRVPVPDREHADTEAGHVNQPVQLTRKTEESCCFPLVPKLELGNEGENCKRALQAYPEPETCHAFGEKQSS